MSYPVYNQNQYPENNSQSRNSKLALYNPSKVTSRNDRNRFIAKVYSILTTQLVITSLYCSAVVASETLQEALIQAYPLVYAAMILSFVVLLVLVCSQKAAKKVPLNYILLGTFTLLEAYILGFICAFTDPVIVLVAALMTVGITGVLTLYAFKTKKDFTTMWAGLFVLVTVLFLFGFFMIFFYSYWLRLIYSLLAVIVFSIFIIFDTQLIAGGRYGELTYDDYVVGALILYIDIVGLFIYLLSLLGGVKD